MPADEQTRDYLTRHRFKVTETSSHELALFRQKLEEFMKLHPEIVGATIFGSHTKGMARTADHPLGKSDMDTFIFVEDEKYNLIPEPHITPRVDSPDDSLTTSLMRNQLVFPFKDLFEQVAGYPQYRMKDINFLPLSKLRIDNDLALFKDKHFNSGKQRTTVTEISKLFHLQLGRGLDSYRAYILSELGKLGTLGDEIWEMYFYKDGISNESAKIMRGMGEEKMKFEDQRDTLYPHTVADAIKYFHLEGVTPKYEVAPSQR